MKLYLALRDDYIYIYCFISVIFSLIFEYEVMDLENITNSNFF